MKYNSFCIDGENKDLVPSEKFLNNNWNSKVLFEMSNTPENIHSHIHFNRIKGTAIISYFEYFKNNPSEYVAFEFIRLKNCKASDIDDKPKF